MPRRQRWQPVRGTGNRVYDTRERLLLGLLDAPGRALAALRGGIAQAPPDPSSVREVLVLRLDRIGDVTMSLPALADLRAALPEARIRLAVGRWSEEIARSAPVDEVLVWSAPWVGRPQEGAEGTRALFARARALGADGLDLAIDLQGDVRANLLLWATRARHRVGYANTGGAYLLHQVVALDETVSWVEQNRRAVAAAVGRAPGALHADPATEADRAAGRRVLEEAGLLGRGPLVGIHPSGGRRIKQWDVAHWAEVAARLEAQFGAGVLLTGSAADRDLAASVKSRVPAAVDLSGRLGLRETLGVLAGLDLFLSPDTGPMHLACAVGTPSVSVFGPSDPVRYFSGGGSGRHLVVRRELWCSPCNLIRRPPAECDTAEGPECLRLVTVDEVHAAAVRLLEDVSGFTRRGAGAAGLP
jgi:heptosyltransferase-2/heptosyltransferase-3